MFEIENSILKDKQFKIKHQKYSIFLSWWNETFMKYSLIIQLLLQFPYIHLVIKNLTAKDMKLSFLIYTETPINQTSSHVSYHAWNNLSFDIFITQRHSYLLLTIPLTYSKFNFYFFHLYLISSVRTFFPFSLWSF